MLWSAKKSNNLVEFFSKSLYIFLSVRVYMYMHAHCIHREHCSIQEESKKQLI